MIGVLPVFKGGGYVSGISRLREEMDRLLDSHPLLRGDLPAINAWSNDNEVMVTTEISGVDPADIDVSVRENVLTIKGERKPDAPQKPVFTHRQERGFGQFARALRLPFDVDSEQIKATYKNGILTVRLPRHESSKPRKIAVKHD